MSTLHDNMLKTDINKIKNTFNQSGYKVRLIIVLLSERSIVESPEVEERLANIRKGTGLDPKNSLFFLPPQSSAVELQSFVETVLGTLYPVCVENYYRDLSKHIRRKRNRGVVPPPTLPPTAGTSQALSTQGWNVRYDLKLGVFAEFRQEMDAALRSYDASYEGLLGDDVFGVIANWSPRWNEARLLADVLAIRILRCLLWNGHTTTACQRWQSHKNRMRDLVDNRGKGSSTYGWEAWESRWAMTMAELIAKARITDLVIPATSAYTYPEKSVPVGERLQPWQHLHNPGYWYRTALQHLLARQARARSIPEEDRSTPDSCPASQVATRARNYDTYLCPEPHVEYPLAGHRGVDHSLLIQNAFDNVVAEFKARNYTRMLEELSLQCAKESMNAGSWDVALGYLRPLWQTMSFRRNGWWEMVEEVGWALRTTAARVGDGGSVVSADWELMNDSETLSSVFYGIRLTIYSIRPSQRLELRFKLILGRINLRKVKTECDPSSLQRSLLFNGNVRI